MCSCMPLQIECVVESFSTKCTEVTLDVRVTFGVAIEQALERKFLKAPSFLQASILRMNYFYLSTDSANIGSCLTGRGRCGIDVRRRGSGFQNWIFESVATVDPFYAARISSSSSSERKLKQNKIAICPLIETSTMNYVNYACLL